MVNSKQINVIKRNGEVEPLNVEKINRIVEKACEGISGVSVSDVVMSAHLNFHDKITSIQIHRAITKSAADLISESAPNYQYVAARLLNYDIRKSVWNSMDPPRLYDHVTKMVESGYYTEELITRYTESDWDKMDQIIDHDRDFNFAYIGLREYLDKYCVRDRSLDDVRPLETPQITYMLISALSAISEGGSIKAIRSLYNDFSLWNISLPTPIMAGLRTPTKQFSSCTLIAAGDSLDSLVAASGAIVKYVAKKAGIGLDLTRIRAEGSPVGKERGVKHTGVTPFLRMFEGALKSCSQGGVRGGSMTVHLLAWHLDIEDLIVLKNNKGTPDTRVRKVDYCIELNDFIYEKFVNNEDLYLFSPHEVPALYDAFYTSTAKFKAEYEKAVGNPNIRKKKVSTRDLLSKITVERKETGRIYIFNAENANLYKPFSVPVTTSNLCQEILLPTAPLNDLNDPHGLISLCTLLAINLGNVKNLDDLESVCRNAVRMLDGLLDYQDYMVPAAKTATDLYRPLGIGVINLAYYLAKNGVSYNSEDGWKLIDETMEAINYYCIKASIELAKERGACDGIANTKWGMGLLPIDYYKNTIDSIVKFEPKQDWGWLREELLKYGIRNATLTAFMPAESSAKISNSTNGVEPVKSLIVTKSNKSNVLRQVVPEINRLKNKYDMLWDMPDMDGIIKSMAVINRLCSQSISTNLSYNPENYPGNEIPMSVLLKDLLKANHYGLPTLYYHNTKDGREEDLLKDQPKVVTSEQSTENAIEEADCDSCKI